MLRNILIDRFGRVVQSGGIVEDALEVLQHGSIVEAITDTLVKDKVHVDIFFTDHASVTVDLIHTAARPKGTEGRTGSEIIQMMINRRDAERPHRRYKE